MQGKTWIELFERIPEKHRDGLGIVTSSGTAINLQSILRLEEEFMVFRGRLVGTVDAQQTFFLPYAQINLIIYQRIVKEEEVLSWFGTSPVPVIAAPAEVPAETQAEAAPEPPPPAVQPVPSMDSAPLPHKAALLERIRKRAGGGPGASAPGTTPKPPVK